MSNGDEPSSETTVSEAYQAAVAAVQTLATAGMGPLTVSGDAGSVTQRSASDLIKIANYLAGVAAAATPRHGVRYTRLIPDATAQGPRRSFRSPWIGYPDDRNGYGWP